MCEEGKTGKYFTSLAAVSFEIPQIGIGINWYDFDKYFYTFNVNVYTAEPRFKGEESGTDKF